MNAILANVFLGCFLVGFILTAISFLFGAATGHSHFHFGGHEGGGHLHFGGYGHAGGHIHGHAGEGGSDGQNGLSIFNYSSAVMFLTWFGGVGMILNSETSGAVLVCLLGATLAGIVGAFIIFLFLGKLIADGNTRMDPTEYYMPGTLAKVTMPIRQGGTGEIVYTQGGARKSAAARTEDGSACNRGEEVVVVSYEKGVAYVKSAAEDFGSTEGQS